MGQFAGKTSSGLLSFGESILNNFVLKTKKQAVEMEFGADENDESDGQQN